MPAHRLPLYRAAPDAADVYPDVPRAAPGAAIAVVDARGDGMGSLIFSAHLCGELAQHGRSMGVALTSFSEPLEVSSAQKAPFGEGQSFCALSVAVSDEALFALLGCERRWLLVGPGALAFAVPLVIMVGADTPILRWPEALRERRGRISLALGGDGVAVAKALGRLLATS